MRKDNWVDMTEAKQIVGWYETAVYDLKKAGKLKFKKLKNGTLIFTRASLEKAVKDREARQAKRNGNGNGNTAKKHTPIRRVAAKRARVQAQASAPVEDVILTDSSPAVDQAASVLDRTFRTALREAKVVKRVDVVFVDGSVESFPKPTPPQSE